MPLRRPPFRLATKYALLRPVFVAHHPTYIACHPTGPTSHQRLEPSLFIVCEQLQYWRVDTLRSTARRGVAIGGSRGSMNRDPRPPRAPSDKEEKQDPTNTFSETMCEQWDWNLQHYMYFWKSLFTIKNGSKIGYKTKQDNGNT